MKQQFFDLQDLTVQVDPEDAQLMAMFPRNRAAAVNEMYLVRRGEETFLLRKEDVARVRKRMQAALDLAVCVVGLAGLIASIACWVHKVGHPGLWLMLFELCLISRMAKSLWAAKGRFEK